MSHTRKPPPGAAFATINQKTGAGRTTTGEPKVPDVETVECRPAFGALPALLHKLVWQRDKIACLHCGGDWAALDAQIRGAA